MTTKRKRTIALTAEADQALTKTLTKRWGMNVNAVLEMLVRANADLPPYSEGTVVITDYPKRTLRQGATYRGTLSEKGEFVDTERIPPPDEPAPLAIPPAEEPVRGTVNAGCSYCGATDPHDHIPSCPYRPSAPLVAAPPEPFPAELPGEWVEPAPEEPTPAPEPPAAATEPAPDPDASRPFVRQYNDPEAPGWVLALGERFAEGEEIAEHEQTALRRWMQGDDDVPEPEGF